MDGACEGAAVMIAPDRRVVSGRAVLDVILRCTDAIVLKNGALFASHPDDQAALERICAQRWRKPVFLIARSMSGKETVAMSLVSATSSGGEPLLCGRFKVATSNGLVRLRPIASAYGLTSAQQRVLLHLLRNASNSAIAERLGISELTVQTHIRNAYARLGIRSRTELLNLVVRHVFL